jgi:hypothetical protein
MEGEGEVGLYEKVKHTIPLFVYFCILMLQEALTRRTVHGPGWPLAKSNQSKKG